jgi:hypothetical protein
LGVPLVQLFLVLDCVDEELDAVSRYSGFGLLWVRLVFKKTALNDWDESI